MSNDKAATLRTGFYTTQSLGDKGCIRIDFNSLADLHQADDELRAFMAKEAEQHQGEPVAWFTEDHLTDKSATTWDGAIADQWRAKGWPVSQLYTHADPGEVERLRAERDQLQADLTARDQRIDQQQQTLLKLHQNLSGTLEQYGYSEEVEALLWPDLHSRPEERGTPEAEPCSGCGIPGYTGTCAKCVPY
ncbi:hypothetical protein ACBQ21_08870 [Pseudomonas putida]|uniref:hypothetical protein n=1 Tax=Pseudomonas putida TaxID=303 RepID=UPI003524CBD4